MTRSTLAQGLLGLAVAVGAAGCTEQGGTLTILQNSFPDEMTCIAEGGEESLINPVGILDLEACIDEVTGQRCDGYIFTPVVRSQAIEPDDGAFVTNEVFLTSADIELTYINTETSFALIEALGDDAKRSQRFSGRITPGGTVGALFPIIDKAQAAKLEAALPDGRDSQVIAKIQVMGKMNGGGVKSSIYEYPVTVCKGCLGVQPPMIIPDSGGMVEESNACLPYQN